MTEWSEEEQLKLEQALVKLTKEAVDGYGPIFELFPERSRQDVMIWIKIIMAEIAAKASVAPAEVSAPLCLQMAS